MSVQPCSLAADCDVGANTLGLAQLCSENVNKASQGANINNSHVENLTINIMGCSFKKRKILS